MKRNLIVLCGAALVGASPFVLPVVTRVFKDNEKLQLYANTDNFAVYFAIAILAVMLLNWKWRGVLWILFSAVGAVFAYLIPQITSIQSRILQSLDSTGPQVVNSSLGPGFYTILGGYLIVVVGAVYDLVQKRKQIAAIPAQLSSHSVPRPDLRRNLIVLCGVGLVIVSAYYLPLATWTMAAGPDKLNELSTHTITGDYVDLVFIAVASLVIMLLKGRWRGAFWIALGIWGILGTPQIADLKHQKEFKYGNNVVDKWACPTQVFAMPGESIFCPDMKSVPTLARPGNFQIGAGFYVFLAGYVTILAGGIWDIIQKRKRQTGTPLLVGQQSQDSS